MSDFFFVVGLEKKNNSFFSIFNFIDLDIYYNLIHNVYFKTKYNL